MNLVGLLLINLTIHYVCHRSNFTLCFFYKNNFLIAHMHLHLFAYGKAIWQTVKQSVNKAIQTLPSSKAFLHILIKCNRTSCHP